MNALLFFERLNILASACFVLVLPLVLFSIEYTIVSKGYNNLKEIYTILNAIYKKNKVNIQSIIYFPILEELIFRYYIYQYWLFLEINIFYYIIISSVAFVLAHIFYQGFTSIVKLIFSFSLNLVFIVTQNVFVGIVIHIIFNFFVYLIHTNKQTHYERG